MRDLLNLIDQLLVEASGGMSKRWLESQQSPIYFLDSQGNKYTIQNLVLLPDQAPAAPVEQLGAELDTAIQQLGFKQSNITFVNRMPAKQAAGVLIVMQDQNKKLYPYFKFASKRDMDNLGIHWSPADFEKETGLAWQQTRMSGSGANRQEQVISRIELKPKFSVPTNTPMSISDVPARSEQTLLANDIEPDLANKLQELLANTLAGNKTPVAGLEPYQRDIQVDYGEVATPLGLVAGKFVGGSFSKVNSDLLQPLGVSWSTASQVFYPEAGNEPLYDSQIMWANGEKLRISNKAEGKGGAASTTSILEIIDRYGDRFSADDMALLEPDGKYGKFITALRTIVRAKSFEGPVRLAQEFEFINDADAESALQNLNAKTNDINLLTPRLREIVQDKTIFDAKTQLPDYKVSYHAVASLARMVVKHLNADIALTTEFFKFMLSRANLVQVNQFAAKDSGGVAYTRFDVIWPPVFTGKIKFSASDFQSNKKPTSRLAFSVGNERGTNTPDADQSTQEPAAAAVSVDALNDKTNQPRLTGPGARAAKTTAAARTDVGTLGRERRSR
jgi:hypothetical protein